MNAHELYDPDAGQAGQDFEEQARTGNGRAPGAGFKFALVGANSNIRSRAENLAKAKALESQDRHREAREYYTKCLDITPELAYQLIKVSSCNCLRLFVLVISVCPY